MCLSDNDVASDSNAIVYLRVTDPYREDAYRLVVRVSQSTLERLNASVGDILLIQNPTNSAKRAVAQALRLRPQEEGEEIIRMNSMIRRSVGVGINDRVLVKKAEIKQAQEVVLAPITTEAYGRIYVDPEFKDQIRRYMLNKPLISGMIIQIQHAWMSLPFWVVRTRPTGPVRFGSDTDLVIIEEPFKKEEEEARLTPTYFEEQQPEQQETIYIDDDLLESARKLAKDLGVSFSSLMEEALRQYLENFEIGKSKEGSKTLWKEYEKWDADSKVYSRMIQDFFVPIMNYLIWWYENLSAGDYRLDFEKDMKSELLKGVKRGLFAHKLLRMAFPQLSKQLTDLYKNVRDLIRFAKECAEQVASNKDLNDSVHDLLRKSKPKEPRYPFFLSESDKNLIERAIKAKRMPWVEYIFGSTRLDKVGHTWFYERERIFFLFLGQYGEDIIRLVRANKDVGKKYDALEEMRKKVVEDIEKVAKNIVDTLRDLFENYKITLDEDTKKELKSCLGFDPFKKFTEDIEDILA